MDFDALRDLLGDVAEGQRERYQFTWPGKAAAKAEARKPIWKTMRPEREKSVDWDTTRNLYIEGDNLDALKLLKETYAGQVKMIYIDPPYNTGHDFVYDDDFAQTHEEYDAESGDYDEDGGRLVANPDTNGRFHSDWCSMIYPRLVLARDLLSDDGVIFISIDKNENDNLQKLCNEIFGSDNLITIFAVENNPKGRKNNAFVSESYEFCYLYAKNCRYIYSLISQKGIKKFFLGFSNKTDKRKVLFDSYGEFRQSKRQVCGVGKSNKLARDSNSSRCFTIYYKESPVEDMQLLDEYDSHLDKYVVGATGQALIEQGYVRYECLNSLSNKPAIPLYSKKTMMQLFSEHSLYFKNDGTIYEKDRDTTQQITSFLPNKRYGLDLMTESATSRMEQLFGVKGIFTNSKSVDFIKALIRLYPSDTALILDLFSGSSTTAQALMQLNAEDSGNRHFIMVQIPEPCSNDSVASKAGYDTICDIGEERIRRAGTKIKTEVEEANKQATLDGGKKTVPDIGFRVLRIDSSNMLDTYRTPNQTTQEMLLGFADNMKPDRTPEDLLFEVLPKFRIPYSARIEEKVLGGKTCFLVDGNRLVACFDTEVGTETIEEIAKLKPDYAVMRDSSMRDDATQANFEELFKTCSPDTVRRVI